MRKTNRNEAIKNLFSILDNNFSFENDFDNYKKRFIDMLYDNTLKEFANLDDDETFIFKKKYGFYDDNIYHNIEIGRQIGLDNIDKLAIDEFIKLKDKIIIDKLKLFFSNMPISFLTCSIDILKLDPDLNKKINYVIKTSNPNINHLPKVKILNLFTTDKKEFTSYFNEKELEMINQKLAFLNLHKNIIDIKDINYKLFVNIYGCRLKQKIPYEINTLDDIASLNRKKINQISKYNLEREFHNLGFKFKDEINYDKNQFKIGSKKNIKSDDDNIESLKQLNNNLSILIDRQELLKNEKNNLFEKDIELKKGINLLLIKHKEIIKQISSIDKEVEKVEKEIYSTVKKLSKTKK